MKMKLRKVVSEIEQRLMDAPILSSQTIMNQDWTTDLLFFSAAGNVVTKNMQSCQTSAKFFRIPLNLAKCRSDFVHVFFISK